MSVLKPNEELIISTGAVAVVYAIFAQTMPPAADVRADVPGNMNTFASVKSAALMATTAVGLLALIGKSPTVFTIGGTMIVLEAWRYHTMNFASQGSASGNGVG